MYLKISRILVPVDFSDISLNALDYAAFIAHRLHSKITLLHVIESYEYNTALKDKKTNNEIIIRGTKSKLQSIIKSNPKLLGLNIEIVHREGKIYKEIHNLTKERKFELIVMGTHGVSGIGNIEKFMLGSNAYRTVFSSSCPVITINNKAKEIKFKDIVLPLDITKKTKKKIEIAIAWAEIFNSTVHIASVSRYIDEYIVDISNLKQQIKEVADRLKAKNIPYTTKMIRHNNIGDSVLKYSKKINADLIIIMTRQEAKWNDFFVGSSARKVIGESKLPVMSVRPQKRQ